MKRASTTVLALVGGSDEDQRRGLADALVERRVPDELRPAAAG